MRACDVGAPGGVPQDECTGQGPSGRNRAHDPRWHLRRRSEPCRAAGLAVPRSILRARRPQGPLGAASWGPAAAHGAPVLPLILASTVLLVPPLAGPLPALVPPAAVAVAGAARGTPGWVPPVDPPLLVAPFDPPAHDWLPGHRGVDLAAGAGTPVHAARAGTVVWAGPLAGRGVVVVEHDDGLRTTYEPVDAVVVEGEQVAAGQLLGTVGDGDVHCGRVPRCLHWGLRRGRDYLDPWRLLRPGRAVLLPP